MSCGSMNDEEFIDYCEAHSETPRSRFHRDDVIRLLDLAGAELNLDITTEFLSIRLTPWCQEARDNIRRVEVISPGNGYQKS